ncbi:MAG: serpin family protein [Dehalococcoidia bacterium]
MWTSGSGRGWAVGVVAAAAILLGGCGSDGALASTEVKADATRAVPSEGGQADVQALAADNADFAWDLYGVLARKDADANLFASPHSISQALAMAFAGARGETATEMAAALHYRIDQDRLHSAFNALEAALTPPKEAPGKDPAPLRLNIANSAWAQKDHPFERAFLETLAVNYGAGVRLIDFARDPEAARETINDWVSERTEERVKDLLPEGSITGLTRLVLANAVYFKADWTHPFTKDATQPGPFTTRTGTSVEVPMMRQQASFAYGRVGGVEAVELPYADGRASMVVLLPPAGGFDAFEAGLDGAGVRALLSSLKPATVNLALPKFEFTAEFSLKEALEALGMKAAFEPERSDFSGMDGTRELFVSGVFHKAFVRVDEKGTEAAAATAVVLTGTSAPLDVVQLTVDRPFVFLIRDTRTGAILFAGRVTNPVAK